MNIHEGKVMCLVEFYVNCNGKQTNSHLIRLLLGAAVLSGTWARFYHCQTVILLICQEPHFPDPLHWVRGQNI